jgi:hypothetical protein
VPADNLKGRALFVYWSLSPEELPAGSFLERTFGLLSRTRWSRTFMAVK